MRAEENQQSIKIENTGQYVQLTEGKRGNLAWIIHDFAGGKRKGALKDG
jgi:hypothetical protein